jgi:hypothetical protein
MNKIYKSYKIIKNRLPKIYNIELPKIYKTAHSMLRAEAKQSNMTYKKLCNWYIKYWEKQKKKKSSYIKTKYYKRKKVHHNLNKALNIVALGSTPIKINIENTRYFTLKNYIFILLHEYGHIYYDKKEMQSNEYLVDMFAIRWIKKFIKERLI